MGTARIPWSRVREHAVEHHRLPITARPLSNLGTLVPALTSGVQVVPMDQVQPEIATDRDEGDVKRR